MTSLSLSNLPPLFSDDPTSGSYHKPLESVQLSTQPLLYNHPSQFIPDISADIKRSSTHHTSIEIHPLINHTPTLLSPSTTSPPDMSEPFNAETAGNAAEIEMQFAVKTVEHLEAYQKLITSIPPNKLKLTP